MRRETSNPVLSRSDAFTRGGYAGFHDAPAGATGTATLSRPDTSRPETLTGPGQAGTPSVPAAAMTINDVVVKTFLLFVVGAVGVGISWATGFNPALTIGAMLLGLVLGLVNTFKKQISVPLIMAYAVVQGVFVGGISALFQSQFGGDTNIVTQAIIGTVVAFAVMLALYSSGKLRATPMFQKIMMVALVSYGLIALISFGAAVFFDVGGGFGFYGVGLLGLALCAAGVLLAAFTLILDFDAIQNAVALGVPEQESWRAAFGLMVTLVWLYIEILRLLAILQGRD